MPFGRVCWACFSHALLEGDRLSLAFPRNQCQRTPLAPLLLSLAIVAVGGGFPLLLISGGTAEWLPWLLLIFLIPTA